MGALSHIKLWLQVAKEDVMSGAYLVVDDTCCFLPGFSQALLETHMKSVPALWDIVFLGGFDLLGTAGAGHQVAPGVRRLYPWFRAGPAYLLSVVGARRALKICTPLRWRLDCQLVGFFASTYFKGSAEERLFGRTRLPVGYCLEPPLAFH